MDDRDTRRVGDRRRPQRHRPRGDPPRRHRPPMAIRDRAGAPQVAMVSKLDSAPTPVADGKDPGEARMPYDCVREPTLASTWHAASSAAITDELLDWPPDVFALANVILARSEAFRFALSPIQEWPPAGHPDWGRT